MGDIESRRSAARLTRSAMPKLPPTTNVTCETPRAAYRAIVSASASLLSSFPSTHRAITAPPRGRRSRIASASRSSAAATSAADGASPRRCSGSSTRLSLQCRPRRFWYSAQASA